MLIWIACFVAVLSLGCGPKTKQAKTASATIDVKGTPVRPEAAFHEMGEIKLGEPLGVAHDISGVTFLADGAPARLLLFDEKTGNAIEFQLPPRNPSFYPTDLTPHGFFVYAVDAVGRTIVRFDNRGVFRDVLIDFNSLNLNRLVTPSGISADRGGRIAVSDVQNHQIIIFNAYMQVEVVFGNYGSFLGQLDTPEGVSFTPDDELAVADSGNRRVQLFTQHGAVLREVPPEGSFNPMVRPRRAVVDAEGRVFVADPEGGMVFVFDDTGQFETAIYPEGAVSFEPSDVDLGRDGRVYVTDLSTRSLYVLPAM